MTGQRPDISKQPANDEAKRAFQLFLLAHFPLPVQSVTIRGVSTKLKVNSGRTNPPGTAFPQEAVTEKAGSITSMVSR